MNNPSHQQPLTFGSAKKHVVRKTNFFLQKNDSNPKILKSESKNKKQNNRCSNSKDNKHHLIRYENHKSKQQQSQEEKNCGWITVSKKYSQCTKTPNSNSVSLRQQCQSKQGLKEPTKIAKKSLSKPKTLTLLQLDKKVRKLSDNTNEVMKIFAQLKFIHSQEEKLMKMVLNDKQMHRYRKILAVEEAEYLENVLKDGESNNRQ